MRAPHQDANRWSAAWSAGIRYFWDPALRERVLELHPEMRPKGPPGFWDIWPHLQAHTLLDPWRAANVADLLYEVRQLPGDVVECGVFRGAVSVMMAWLLREWRVPKRVHALDSFQGLPQPQAGVDRFYQAGWAATDDTAIRRLARLARVQDRVIIHPGWFKDTLRAWRAPVCFSHIDGDLYQSTRDALAGLAPHWAQGAQIAVDDYHDDCGGVLRAGVCRRTPSPPGGGAAPSGDVPLSNTRQALPGTVRGPSTSESPLFGLAEVGRGGPTSEQPVRSPRRVRGR